MSEISKIKIFLFALAFSLIMPGIVQALSLGSVQKNDYSALGNGGSTDFTVLLWNTEELPCIVTMSEKKVEGFTVTIFPREFVLSQSKIGPPYDNGEYVQLPIGNVRASSVRIVVTASENVKEGIYVIPVSLTAESVESGIKSVQEKTFNFRINVSGSSGPGGSQNSGGISSNPLGNIKMPDFSGMTGLIKIPKISIPKVDVPNIDQRFILIAISLAVIISISAIVYRIS